MRDVLQGSCFLNDSEATLVLKLAIHLQTQKYSAERPSVAVRGWKGVGEKEKKKQSKHRILPLLPFKTSVLFLLLSSPSKINGVIKKEAHPSVVDILGSPFGAVKLPT
ncbi:hypothetical protein ATANTOWER_020500 [Ataeniobius toweri]|uniref:Uncharacterized protein n=1 Tax=Ataeniobius toweri TaxID=208326 RepID=A0ABU7ABQ2_9TELE|nr:hypothetical protein [Ataeniobius toweri]